MNMTVTLFALSVAGGFCSGLLGVGGAVLLIPLLLTVPPLLGAGELSMHAVSGLTMVQVFAASLTGWLSHRRSGHTHRPTILGIGLPMALFAFVGAAVSRAMSPLILLLIFGGLVTAAFFLLWRGAPGGPDGETEFTFNRTGSVISGSCVGFLSGVVGAGGGFILMPVMISLLHIPIRVAVGSSLGIVFLGALMGSLGKMLTLQIPWVHLLPVLAGSLPASLLGARASKALPAARIRHLLLALVFLILIKTWYDLYRLLRAGG